MTKGSSFDSCEGGGKLATGPNKLTLLNPPKEVRCAEFNRASTNLLAERPAVAKAMARQACSAKNCQSLRDTKFCF
jgi:hypothetical protein